MMRATRQGFLQLITFTSMGQRLVTSISCGNALRLLASRFPEPSLNQAPMCLQSRVFKHGSAASGKRIDQHIELEFHRANNGYGIRLSKWHGTGNGKIKSLALTRLVHLR